MEAARCVPRPVQGQLVQAGWPGLAWKVLAVEISRAWPRSAFEREYIAAPCGLCMKRERRDAKLEGVFGVKPMISTMRLERFPL